jgi:hypothetical protein
MDDEKWVYYEGYGTRPKSLRAHWVNCWLEEPDGEIIEIDRMEDQLDSKEQKQAQEIRRLITRFEVCHWNSDHWLERILQAIAEEQVPPTSGRPRTQHPLAQMLICLRGLLKHWVNRSTTPVPQCVILDPTGTGDTTGSSTRCAQPSGNPRKGHTPWMMPSCRSWGNPTWPSAGRPPPWKRRSASSCLR